MFYTETYCPGVADFDRDGKLAYEAILRILKTPQAATPIPPATM